MKLLILNGPNLNLLGIREPEIYGKQTYNDLCKLIEAHAEKLCVEVEIRQTNHEGVLVDWIQEAQLRRHRAESRSLYAHIDRAVGRPSCSWCSNG